MREVVLRLMGHAPAVKVGGPASCGHLWPKLGEGSAAVVVGIVAAVVALSWKGRMGVWCSNVAFCMEAVVVLL